MRYTYLHTRGGLMVVIAGRVHTIPSDHRDFKEIVKAVTVDEVHPAQLLSIISRAARKVEELLTKASERKNLSMRVTVEDGIVHIDGKQVYNAAADDLCRMLYAGYDVGPLCAFLEKQQDNPDPSVAEHLYSFLKVGNIPIAADGDFLAYKAVRADYKDIHSGTFLNAIGCVCQVNRETVDRDRSRTCSTGLHVCSYGYLPSFASAQGHVMLCKISPRDVVAIPGDYNDTKMRVCRYEVVGEVTGYYLRGEDVLKEMPRTADRRYVVEVGQNVTEDYGRVVDVDFEEHSAYYTLDEARLVADDIKKGDSGFDVVRVYDLTDDKEAYEA